MAVRLIRENSDTPNVTNKDDARMIRYAYGGQNGFVKGRGAELEYSVSDNVFTVNSGVINVQGWEVEIDSNGWSTTLSASDADKKYFAVYCEVNLTVGGSAKIDLMSALNDFPDVPEGDDLTANPSGTARLVLYNFVAQKGNISEVSKKVNMMLYGAVMTTRPPISDIQFLGGSDSLSLSGVVLKGEHLQRADILQNGNGFVNTRISYLPKGSTASIAKAEFIYSANNDYIEYIMQPSGDMVCYAKNSFRARQTAEEGYKRVDISVKAKITDLYGNVYTLEWVEYGYFEV